MGELDKGIHVVYTPGSEDWPVPPVYEPLWPAYKIREEVERLVKYQGPEAKAMIDLDEVVKLGLRIAGDYDQAFSKSQRNEWALGGVGKSSVDLEEDAR